MAFVMSPLPSSKKISGAGINGVKAGNILMLGEDPGNTRSLVGGGEVLHTERCGYGAVGYDDGDQNFNEEENREAFGAIHAIKKALDLGATKFAFFGYSHGGSTMRLLTEYLKANPAQFPSNAKVMFTAYIDAVRIPSDNEASILGVDPDDRPHARHEIRPTGTDTREWDEPEFRFPYLSTYHLNLYQLNPAQNEKMYIEPDGFNDGGEFLDLRGGWMEPERNFRFNADTGDTENDGAQKPSQFYQGNVEDSGYNDDDAFDPLQSQNKLLLGGEPPPWVLGVDHAEGPGPKGGIDDAGAVHNFILYHMKRAMAT